MVYNTMSQRQMIVGIMLKKFDVKSTKMTTELVMNKYNNRIIDFCFGWKYM